ncbi:hypothetical protein [Cupriavidus taiwanensis]|uniref:hypothetical protein n=2 Tax=Cupriavidus taiwanensis TaxID=164546 RepID=UPI0011AE4CAA|nr:hypothetical protein [Cupriavidus taiwanensis]
MRLAPTIQREPVTELRRWDIRQLVGGAWHLAGHTVDGRVRVSSATIWFDLHLMSAGTASGRVYRLADAPGHSEETNRLWAGWCLHNGISQSVSVAAEIWAARLEADARLIID